MTDEVTQQPVPQPSPQPSPRVTPARWMITLAYKHNTIEGTPDDTYTVVSITNSLDYFPGQTLSRADVEYIFSTGGWELTIQ